MKRHVEVDCVVTVENHHEYERLETALEEFAVQSRIRIAVVDEYDNLLMLVNGKDVF